MSQMSIESVKPFRGKPMLRFVGGMVDLPERYASLIGKVSFP
jgi:hypothetical protein